MSDKPEAATPQTDTTPAASKGTTAVVMTRTASSGLRARQLPAWVKAKVDLLNQRKWRPWTPEDQLVMRLRAHFFCVMNPTTDRWELWGKWPRREYEFMLICRVCGTNGEYRPVDERIALSIAEGDRDKGIDHAELEKMKNKAYEKAMRDERETVTAICDEAAYQMARLLVDPHLRVGVLPNRPRIYSASGMRPGGRPRLILPGR